ncbi:hypothetical protein [Mangrovicoccus sp. HB161399]|uniref:hypothetical protein n=1 Tax=Mangrovicoccus sp. HB161399 TaxID=2720392 RepID=UPI001557ADDA|nr:hypothetical protein [Mangrovicoccus sp. HB161399]
MTSAKAGAATVKDGAADDTVNGNASQEPHSGADADVIPGGGGVKRDAGRSTVDLRGDVSLIMGAGDYALRCGSEGDTIFGGKGRYRMQGGCGADLAGLDAENGHCSGNASDIVDGNDVLTGDPGTDVLLLRACSATTRPPIAGVEPGGAAMRSTMEPTRSAPCSIWRVPAGAQTFPAPVSPERS